MNAITNDGSERCPCPQLTSYKRGSRPGAYFAHQKICIECLDWLWENDLGRFEDVLNRALKTRGDKMYPVVTLAACNGYALPEHKVDFDINVLNSIIESCKPCRLPIESVYIPSLPGVYVLVINNSGKNRAIYVGESSLSIKNRWMSHHKRDDFLVLIRAGIELTMYCLLMPQNSPDGRFRPADFAGVEESAIKQAEKNLIGQLRPTLNNL